MHELTEKKKKNKELLVHVVHCSECVFFVRSFVCLFVCLFLSCFAAPFPPHTERLVLKAGKHQNRARLSSLHEIMTGATGECSTHLGRK